MEAREQDPARAVLDRVITLTVKKGRFPREAWFIGKKTARTREAVRQLVDDRRYLARLEAGDEHGPWPARLAVTALGLQEVATPLGSSELIGLARAHERLLQALRANVFDRHVVRIDALRDVVAQDIELADFRRWCTVLCSPRLQGRYLDDPHGAYGRSDAFGIPDRRTGYLAQVYLWGTFSTWSGLPQREPRRTLLFPVGGLRVREDEHGQVHLLSGDGEAVVLRASVGTRVLSALVDRPHRELHTLDLQAHGSGHPVLDDGEDYDACNVGARLADFAIALDGETCSPDEVARWAALLRRLDLLESLTSSDGSLPKWAGNDASGSAAALIQSLKADLVDGPLRADHPTLKNATKVVNRALERVLEAETLAHLRGDFHGHERIVYRPKT